MVDGRPLLIAECSLGVCYNRGVIRTAKSRGYGNIWPLIFWTHGAAGERSEGRDLGMRVFLGQHAAIVSSSTMDPSSFKELAERAVAMARVGGDAGGGGDVVMVVW